MTTAIETEITPITEETKDIVALTVAHPQAFEEDFQFTLMETLQGTEFGEIGKIGGAIGSENSWVENSPAITVWLEDQQGLKDHCPSFEFGGEQALKIIEAIDEAFPHDFVGIEYSILGEDAPQNGILVDQFKHR